MIGRIRDAAMNFISGNNKEKPYTESAGFLAINSDQNLGSSDQEHKTLNINLEIAAVEKKLNEARNNPDHVDSQQIRLLEAKLDNLYQAKNATKN